MKKIAGVVEGLILTVIGAYAGLLVLFGDYWRFLNPKFQWLTGVTAAMLIVVGTIATLNPNKRPSFSRILVFLVLLRIMFMASSGIPVTRQADLPPELEGPSDAQPRAAMNGREYIRINLAELYVLCREGEPDKLADHYVVRGMVSRSEQLDRSGQFVLLRPLITCCLADSVLVGFRAQHDRLDEIADGQWVEVYLTLRGLSEKPPPAGLRIKGMRMVALSDSHILAPDGITGIDEPEIPFIFDIREAEPYAY
jgi:hypothetical protein